MPVPFEKTCEVCGKTYLQGDRLPDDLKFICDGCQGGSTSAYSSMSDDEDEILKDLFSKGSKVDSEFPDGDEEIDESSFPVEPIGRIYGPEASEQVERILAAVPSANRTVVEDLMTEASVAFVDALLAPRRSPKTGRVQRNPRCNIIRDLILQKGFVTSLEVREERDERAINELEDYGIPLRRRSLTVDGRQTTRYEFDPDKFTRVREGRYPLSRKEKEALISMYGGKCEFCGDTDNLQGDHRIHWRIVDNSVFRAEGLSALMLLCPSHNTNKEDVCSKCHNNDPDVCRGCRWAYPKDYTHVAGEHYLIEEFRAEEGTRGAELIQEFKLRWLEAGLGV